MTAIFEGDIVPVARAGLAVAPIGICVTADCIVGNAGEIDFLRGSTVDVERSFYKEVPFVTTKICKFNNNPRLNCQYRVISHCKIVGDNINNAGLVPGGVGGQSTPANF